MIEKEINFEDEDVKTPPDDTDELAEVASYGPPKIRYYESRNVLGRLYREIDEFKFLEEIQEQSRGPAFATGISHSLGRTVWLYVKEKTELIQWRHHEHWAGDVRDK